MSLLSFLALPASTTSFSSNATSSTVTPLEAPLATTDAGPLNASTIDAVSLSGTEAVATDFSILGLIMHADFVVKVVIAILCAASVWSWAIIFSKYFKLRFLTRQACVFEELFWGGGSLDDLYERIKNRIQTPMEILFISAMREWQRSFSKKTKSDQATSIQSRIDRVMDSTLNRETEDLEKHVGFLASVGSVAPFIGLFGTVWGIMISFEAIAASNTTNLAVVAPGIAEALFTTALGLIVAIPANIAYNKISSDINRYNTRLETFAQEFSSIISRQLEESH